MPHWLFCSCVHHASFWGSWWQRLADINWLSNSVHFIVECLFFGGCSLVGINVHYKDIHMAWQWMFPHPHVINPNFFIPDLPVYFHLPLPMTPCIPNLGVISLFIQNVWPSALSKTLRRFFPHCCLSRLPWTYSVVAAHFWLVLTWRVTLFVH